MPACFLLTLLTSTSTHEVPGSLARPGSHLEVPPAPGPSTGPRDRPLLPSPPFPFPRTHGLEHAPEADMGPRAAGALIGWLWGLAFPPQPCALAGWALPGPTMPGFPRAHPANTGPELFPLKCPGTGARPPAWGTSSAGLLKLSRHRHQPLPDYYSAQVPPRGSHKGAIGSQALGLLVLAGEFNNLRSDFFS